MPAALRCGRPCEALALRRLPAREAAIQSIWEGSAVLYGANPNTPVLQLIKAEFDEELSQDDLIYLRFDRVIKRLREDKFSENNKSLLLIELLQLQNYFINQSQQKATKQTISQDVIEAIKEFCGELN